MNFNKCCRCGCFYLNNSHVCPNCEQKDLSDISTLKITLMKTDYLIH